MDQCSGEFITHLRAATLSMENSYFRLEGYRTATIAACALVAPCPEALSVFQKIVKIEKKYQKTIELYWKEQQASWDHLLFVRCHLPIFTHVSRFPAFDFPELDGDITDLANVKELSFLFQPHTRILNLSTPQLRSTAQLKKDHFHAWTIRWIE